MSVYEKQILMQIWGGRTSLLNLSRWAREKSILQDSTSEGSAAAALKAQLMLFREQSRLIKVHLMFFREYSRSNKEGCVHACVQASVCVCVGVGVCVHVNIAQSCLTLCDPMNHSTPGLPIHLQLPESTQTHAHWVGDIIQLSHPLSAPSPPALNFSSIRVFLNESALCIRRPKYWRFSFNISPPNE